MRILYATDGSPSAGTALDMLLALPLRASDHITVLAVPIRSYAGVGMEGTGAYFAEIVEQETAAAERLATEARERILAKGLSASTVVEEGPAAHAIVEVGRTERADLIVLGSRGLGRFAGLLLGSTARAVAQRSPIPVLVVRDRRTAPRRILIAVDGSDDANAAMRTLAAMPLPKDLEITLLHVQPERKPPDMLSSEQADELKAAIEREERRAAVDVFAAARELLPPGSGARIELERGDVREMIIATAAARGSDLIVLGARGRTPRHGVLQGSTADRILEHARCAVLVARAHQRAEPTDAPDETVAGSAR